MLGNGRAVHLVLSRGAHEVFRAEQGLTIPVDPDLQLAFWRERLGTPQGTLTCHRWNDQSARLLAEFSNQSHGDPALQHGNGGVLPGMAQDLIRTICRCAPEERRPLVIAPREMPFNLIHLRNLTAWLRLAQPLQHRFPLGTPVLNRWTRWLISWLCACLMLWMKI